MHVSDELFEEMKAKDDEIRDSKRLAIAEKRKDEDGEEDYLEKLMKELGVQNTATEEDVQILN